MSDMEYSPDIMTLVDDDGVEAEFELIDTIEVDGQRYFAMTPYYSSPDDITDESDALVVLKGEIVDDEELLVSIDDDDEYERIGKIFMERIEKLMDEMFEEEAE